MAFGNRLINTGGGAIAGPTGANLEALGFGGDSWPNAWTYGIDAYDGQLYNINRDSYLIGEATWPPTVFSATYPTGFPNPYRPEVIARESDGNFLVRLQTIGMKRYNSSYANPVSVGGGGYDITAIDTGSGPAGYAATNTSNLVSIYNNSGTLVNSWTPSEGGTSAYNGIAWDGGGLWVSSENSVGSGAGAVIYKYDLDGNYTGSSFSVWVGRPFSTFCYDPIQEKFYGFQRSSQTFYNGTFARYGATFD